MKGDEMKLSGPWDQNRKYGEPHPLGWHAWFAWYPVEVNGDRYWLQTVDRKGSWWLPCEPVCGGCWHWEYRV